MYRDTYTNCRTTCIHKIKWLQLKIGWGILYMQEGQKLPFPITLGGSLYNKLVLAYKPCYSKDAKQTNQCKSIE